MTDVRRRKRLRTYVTRSKCDNGNFDGVKDGSDRTKGVVRVRPAMRVSLRVSLILQSALQEGEVKGWRDDAALFSYINV